MYKGQVVTTYTRKLLIMFSTGYPIYCLHPLEDIYCILSSEMTYIILFKSQIHEIIWYAHIILKLNSMYQKRFKKPKTNPNLNMYKFIVIIYIYTSLTFPTCWNNTKKFNVAQKSIDLLIKTLFLWEISHI